MKRTLKKNIAILLCLCLCLSLFPAAYAEGDVLAEPDGGADAYEQVLAETDGVLQEIDDRLIDEEIVLEYPEVETLYEEVPGEGEIPEETADAVRETPEEENLSGKLGTAFAGISIPQIEQNEIPESTTRRSYVSAASALLTAESFRDGLCPVLFYTEKGYDLIGLVVADGAGKVLEPAATDGGWTYLLAPGAYTYRYHDDRAIFADIGETAFTVDGALEIALDLTAAFANDFVFSLEINPLYDDILDASALEVSDEVREETLDAMTQQRLAEAEGGRRLMLRAAPTPAQQVRSNLVARVEQTPFSFYSDDPWEWDDLSATFKEISDEALQHTGNHWEGDTLHWIYSASGTYHPDTLDGLNVFDSEKNQYRHDFTVVFLLRTTAAQEQAVCSAVESMAAGLHDMSEYQKAFAINQWLYQNVNYDYTHEKDKTYQRQFTDYAALFDRIAVCQGFSIAFYRIALAAGLNARVVTSTSMGHAWNIVSIDGVWYELDSTWDSNRREGGTQLSQLPYYFLRGSTWWSTGHGNGGIGDQFDPEAKYYDPSFDAYTLSQADYTPEEPKTYIVSYNANGGDSVPGNQVKIHGTDLTLTTEKPARADPPETRYYLTLDANGGTIEVEDNPPAPSKRYYRDFTGKYGLLRWNTKSNKTGTDYYPGGIYSENASMELFAIWGRTYPHVSLKTLSVPTREGYRFIGWGKTSTATTIVEDNYSMGSNPTLYAVWEANTYTVSYDANGGENAPTAQTKTHDVPLPITSAQPTRAAASETITVSFDGNGSGTAPAPIQVGQTKAYAFKNWNTKADGTGTEYASNAPYIANEDATLYAQWDESVTTSPETIQLPTSTRAGYYFAGWGTSPDAATGITGIFTPTEDATFYAVWVQPDFFMPDFLTDVEEEAFAGCAFTFVKLSEDTATVGPRAFADCPNLKYIYIPAETTVDPTAFENVEGLTVFRPAA